MTYTPNLVTAVLLTSCLIPFAQDDVVTDDIRFAENLAKFKFFDLADEVLSEIQTEADLDNDQEGNVVFTKARILRMASESTADEDQRLKWQTEAIELLSDWAKPVTAFIYHDKRPDALTDLSNLLQARGALRTALAEDETGSRADTQRTLADGDFKDAHDALVTLQREFESRATQLEAEDKLDEASDAREKAALTFYQRGLNFLLWSEVSAERDYRLEQALEALVDYQWALEEETLAQFFALHFQGIVLSRLGDLDEALTVQAEVVDRGQDFWEAYGADPKAAGLIAELFDRSWIETAKVHVENDNLDLGHQTVDAMLAWHERENAEFPRAGYKGLLDWAELLKGLGDRGRAGELVQLVAERAGSLPEGERAQRMLSEFFEDGAGGGDATAEVLIAAARGFEQERKYADAAFMFQRGIAMLDDGNRDEFELDAWIGTGAAFAQEKRHLEAALAYEHALDVAIARDADEETLQRAAGGMYRNFDRRYKETGDAFDKRLRDQASERLIAIGISGDLPFINAKEHFDEVTREDPPVPAHFVEVYDEFTAVDETSSNYERALVYQARALAGAGRIDEALAKYDEMLARVDDPAFKPANAKSKQAREIATAEALNYKATLLLDERVGKPSEALALLENFEVLLENQPGFIESVKYLRVKAWTQLGDVSSAEAGLADLLDYKRESTYARLAAFEVAQALLTASEGVDDEAERQDLLRRAADAMWTYNDLAGFPSFSNVLTCADWYAQVGRPADAARAYQKALDSFGTSGSGISEAHLDQARIGLATAYNELKDFGKSRPLWKDLLARHPRHERIMVGSARGFGGWLEAGSDGTVTEVPGSGDFDEAFSLWSEIHQGAKTRRPESIWYESKLGAIYSLYRSGAAKPQNLVDARKILDSLRVMQADYDEMTIDTLPPEKQYSPLFKPLFKYLERKIPPR